MEVTAGENEGARSIPSVWETVVREVAEELSQNADEADATESPKTKPLEDYEMYGLGGVGNPIGDDGCLVVCREPQKQRVYKDAHSCRYCRDLILEPNWREFRQAKLREGGTQMQLRMYNSKRYGCLYWRWFTMAAGDSSPSQGEAASLPESRLPTSHSCTDCIKYHQRAFDTTGAPNAWLEALHGQEYDVGMESFGEVSQAAGAGCSFFQWVDSTFLGSRVGRPTLRVAFRKMYGSGKLVPAVCEAVAKAGSSGRMDKNASISLAAGESKLAVVNVYAPRDSAASTLFAEPPNLDPGALSTSQSLKDWLRRCHRKQEAQEESQRLLLCSQAPLGLGRILTPIMKLNTVVKRFAKYPLRVLNVQYDSGKQVRLEFRAGSLSKYAALSYCWGGHQALTATKLTLEALESGVPSSMLPTCLADAAKLTARLGLSYLWVDALCIVQDDPEELESQLGRLLDIYHGAYVTIVAEEDEPAVLTEPEFYGFLKVVPV
ncbi:Heterokaryon incompatibility protein (HET) domain containing protein [Rhypophila decipiens]